MEGIIPPFYEEKVQLNIESGQGVPDHIFLCILFIFLFLLTREPSPYRKCFESAFFVSSYLLEK